MGNDFFSTFITGKKRMIVNISKLFFQFFVGDKVNIGDQLDRAVEIYINDFYLEENDNVDQLEEYFPFNNFDDFLMKKIVLSITKNYKEKKLEIEKNKNLIIIMANAIYFSILLAGMYWEWEEKPEAAIDSLFSKYAKKIKIKDDESIHALASNLISIWKTEEAAYKKIFKILNNMQYSIDTEKILDCYRGYWVTLNADIKPLSKYSDKEKKQIMDSKDILLDYTVISLELTTIHIIKDLLSDCKDNLYFIKVSISCFDKPKYKQAVDTILSHPFLKKHIILVFDYREVKDGQKHLADIRNDGYAIATIDVEKSRITTNSFKNIQYVFATSQFIDDYSHYKDSWKDIKFIIS